MAWGEGIVIVNDKVWTFDLNRCRKALALWSQAEDWQMGLSRTAGVSLPVIERFWLGEPIREVHARRIFGALRLNFDQMIGQPAQRTPPPWRERPPAPASS